MSRHTFMTRWTQIVAVSAVLFVPFTGSHAEPIPLVAASSAAPGSTIREHFVAFEHTIKRTFDGDIEVTLLVDGETGSEETSLASLRRGRVHFSVMSVAAASTVVPELALLMSPYLFNSDEEADYVLDNFLLEPFTELFAKKGVVLVRWVDSGWAVIYGQKPILWPRDAAGYRMRAASALTAQKFLDAVDADVIPLPFADIIPALQTGLIDGGATSPFMYLVGGLYEHAKELTLTRHALNPGTVIANKSWFDALSKKNQHAVVRAYAPSAILRVETRTQTCEAYNILRSLGVNVHEPSYDQRQAWKTFAERTHGDVVRKIGGRAAKIYDTIIAGKIAFAATGVIAVSPCG